jgi:hypothetical protein
MYGIYPQALPNSSSETTSNGRQNNVEDDSVLLFVADMHQRDHYYMFLAYQHLTHLIYSVWQVDEHMLIDQSALAELSPSAIRQFEHPPQH